MPLLSSSIVKHQLASMQEVEEALARQSAHGGDLLTNLLEIHSLSEVKLATALAETFGLEAAPIGELPRPSERVRRLLPADVAQRYACHPLEESGGTLTLAVSEPLPAEVESDLGFALGVSIVQRIAPLVRVRQAIARDYALTLDPRVGRALARLEGRADPSPSWRPPGDVRPAERPATLAPGPVAARPIEPAPAALAPAPPSVEPSLPPETKRPAPGPSKAEFKALVRATRPEPPKPRRLGPYTTAMVERDLLDATERDQALRAFFDFAEQYFEYAALFAVHADIAEGRDAHGPGASREKVQAIGVSLDLPSVLATARDSGRHVLVRLGGSGLDAQLAKDLERRPGQHVLLLPIRVRGRTILILYGDHGEREVNLHAVGDVISFAPLVGATLERLIVERKRGRAEVDSIASLLPRKPPRPPLPSPEERVEALVSVLSARPPAAPAPDFDPLEALEPEEPTRLADPIESSPPPASRRPLAESAPPASRLAESAPPASRRPLADLVESSPPGSRGRPLAPGTIIQSERSHSSAPPRSIEEALARPVIAVGPRGPRPSERPTDPPEVAQRESRKATSLPPHAVDAGWGELVGGHSPFGRKEGGTRPGVGSVRQPEAALRPSPESPVVSVGAESPDVSIGAEPTDDELAALVSEGGFVETDPQGVPLASISRVDSHSARPLPVRGTSTELRLPTVIVDVAADCKTLLEQLLAGDQTAGERLVEAGAAAVPVLVAAFPGPIEIPSTRRGSSLPRASECGPILKALARLGIASVPFLVVRTNDADPHVRVWATRLLGEIPNADSAHAVARRFFDGDVEVRRSALAAARQFVSSPETMATLVAELGITAEDRMKPTAVRLTAMEMLAELRHPQAVPYLVLALTDNPIDIVQAARRALAILARQDFGTMPADWSDWWRTASGRHRIEWLIDALTHDSAEIRRAAGEELKALTREYFGYYDDLPAAERVQAQLKYREWWDTRGKARFR
ncbi:MAG TPA: hypothetical protein VGK73_05050 [Polyangiaceae bacterium]